MINSLHLSDIGSCIFMLHYCNIAITIQLVNFDKCIAFIVVEVMCNDGIQCVFFMCLFVLASAINALH